MTRTLLAALIGALSLSACAQQPAGDDSAAAATSAADAPTTATAAAPATPEGAVRTALESLAPNIKIDRLAPAPLPGFTEATISGQVVYVSNDGKYLLQGTLYDIPAREDLTEASKSVLRREALKSLGADKRIVFAPAQPRHTVTVFTDIDCGYCRRLHDQIADYNKQGIAVEYVFFPRAGLGSDSFEKAVAVWCAADQRQALTEAKAGKDVPRKNCNNPVAMEYTLGQKIGIDGTPAIYTADGVQIGGYLAPEQMRQRLDQLAAKAAPATAAN